MKLKYACLIPMLILTLVAVAKGAADNQIFCKGMLGSYGKDKEFPFYLLAIPNGVNVWGDAAKTKLNGKWDMNKKPESFSATGSFYLAEKTKVKIETAESSVSVTIDKLGYALLTQPGKWSSAEVEMAAGLHTIMISVGNNGGQMPHCGVRITDATGKFEAPIFFTKYELGKFVAKYPKGAMELSDWDAKSAAVEIKMVK